MKQRKILAQKLREARVAVPQEVPLSACLVPVLPAQGLAGSVRERSRLRDSLLILPGIAIPSLLQRCGRDRKHL